MNNNTGPVSEFWDPLGAPVRLDVSNTADEDIKRFTTVSDRKIEKVRTKIKQRKKLLCSLVWLVLGGFFIALAQYIPAPYMLIIGVVMLAGTPLYRWCFKREVAQVGIMLVNQLARVNLAQKNGWLCFPNKSISILSERLYGATDKFEFNDIDVSKMNRCEEANKLFRDLLPNFNDFEKTKITSMSNQLWGTCENQAFYSGVYEFGTKCEKDVLQQRTYEPYLLLAVKVDKIIKKPWALVSSRVALARDVFESVYDLEVESAELNKNFRVVSKYKFDPGLIADFFQRLSPVTQEKIVDIRRAAPEICLVFSGNAIWAIQPQYESNRFFIPQTDLLKSTKVHPGDEAHIMGELEQLVDLTSKIAQSLN